jgi:hypothetical protein
MATYGLTTYKADGTTVVLQNSTKSAVYGQTYTLAKSNTAGAVTVKSFTEYTGRTIRPMQLSPGAHNWVLSYVNSVPTITFTEGAGLSNTFAAFYYGDTVLHIFVK